MRRLKLFDLITHNSIDSLQFPFHYTQIEFDHIFTFGMRAHLVVGIFHNDNCLFKFLRLSLYLCFTSIFSIRRICSLSLSLFGSVGLVLLALLSSSYFIWLPRRSITTYMWHLFTWIEWFFFRREQYLLRFFCDFSVNAKYIQCMTVFTLSTLTDYLLPPFCIRLSLSLPLPLRSTLSCLFAHFIFPSLLLTLYLSSGFRLSLDSYLR